MSRIDEAFVKLRDEKRKALVIFLTAGDPSLRATSELVRAVHDSGADIVELGVAFSDPLADGPVIQKSFSRAIANGANLVKTIDMVRQIRRDIQVPLVFMLASTLVINHGVKRFMRDCSGAGIDGLIIPDAPPEESEEFVPAARSAGLDTIFLAAPTSTSARFRKIASLSTGFIYYINVKGVTGVSAPSQKDVSAQVAKLKKMTKLPVLAGFGVRTGAQARALSRCADGVIIGSKAVEIVHAGKNRAGAVRNLARFVSSIRKEMDRR